ncbi:MAG: alpha/beta fold hydrolase [Calditrichaeota bacterium]|nr:MAG: alpha/beta fold hydrolase [Calditrichota bacterium]
MSANIAGYTSAFGGCKPMPLPVLTLGDPQKPAVLFLHGFMGCKEDWLPVARSLTDMRHALIPDLPDHGSHSIQADSLTVAAGLLQKILLEKGYTRVDVVGYSMGGRLALEMRHRFPDIFRRMVLESVFPGFEDPETARQRYRQDQQTARRLRRISLEAFLDEWYEAPLFDGLKNSPGFEEMLRRRRKNDPDRLSRALVAFSSGRQWNNLPALAQSEVPVMYISGEKDGKYSAIARKLQATRGNRTHVRIFKNVSHNVHAMAPEAFARAVRAFLSK